MAVFLERVLEKILGKQIGKIAVVGNLHSGNDFGNILSCVHTVLYIGSIRNDSLVGDRRNNSGIPK